MSFRILSSGVVVFSVAFLAVSTALAQRNNNPAMQQRMQGMQPIKTGGTLIAATPSQIQIATNTNQTMYVMVMPSTQISVTGTAEQDYLKSGVTVEFVAEVAKGGAVKDKISHLVVVTPTTERPVGLYPPESAAPDKKGDKAEPLAADAGIGDAPPAKGRKPHGKKEADPFGADPLANKPSKGHGAAPQFPGTFSVRGTIKLCKNGAISVAAGHGPTIKGELASDITIDVDMADFRAAQRDDKVTVSGKCSQARPNMVMAESIAIELANPLSGTKKHAAHAKTPAAHTGKAKKGAADADDLLGGGK